MTKVSLLLASVWRWKKADQINKTKQVIPNTRRCDGFNWWNRLLIYSSPTNKIALFSIPDDFHVVVPFHWVSPNMLCHLMFSRLQRPLQGYHIPKRGQILCGHLSQSAERPWQKIPVSKSIQKPVNFSTLCKKWDSMNENCLRQHEHLKTKNCLTPITSRGCGI